MVFTIMATFCVVFRYGIGTPSTLRETTNPTISLRFKVSNIFPLFVGWRYNCVFFYTFGHICFGNKVWSQYAPNVQRDTSQTGSILSMSRFRYGGMIVTEFDRFALFGNSTAPYPENRYVDRRKSLPRGLPLRLRRTSVCALAAGFCRVPAWT